MQYVNPSFSVPPAKLKDQKNRHGQTWEDIFNAPGTPRTLGEFLAHKDDCPCAVCVQFREDYPARYESVPDATGDSINKERQDEVSLWDSEQADKTGHTCNGTYKTFSAAHCPYCWAEHAR